MTPGLQTNSVQMALGQRETAGAAAYELIFADAFQWLENRAPLADRTSPSRAERLYP